MPPAEVILWSRLKGKQLDGHKFRRQFSINAFVVDFYSPELKLAIEVDGSSHFTESASFTDKERQRYLEAFGIQFIRFTNKEICENLEGAVMTIIKQIEKITSPHPSL